MNAGATKTVHGSRRHATAGRSRRRSALAAEGIAADRRRRGLARAGAGNVSFR